MQPETVHTLLKAYRLIKLRDQAAARSLITSVLAAEPDNIDAWWLAAHAATHPEDIQAALGQVLRINPEHRAAHQMLERLDAYRRQGASVHPASTPRKRTYPAPSGGLRWVWNVVLVLGVVGLAFGALALVSAFKGLEWFDNTVESVGDTLGVELGGASEQYGTLQGGDPDQPQDIPITVKESIAPGDIMVNVLKRDEAHIWEFNAQQGQEVLIMLQFSVAGDARQVMELRDQVGRVVDTGAGALDSGTVTLVRQLARAGRYQIVIIGRPDGPRGSYNLAMELQSW